MKARSGIPTNSGDGASHLVRLGASISHAVRVPLMPREWSDVIIMAVVAE